MPELHETITGKKLFESPFALNQLKRIADALERIATSLEVPTQTYSATLESTEE